MANDREFEMRRVTCDEKDFEQAFRVLDHDKSGYVTAAKLYRVMTSLIGENPTEAEVQDLISANDSDGKQTQNTQTSQKLTPAPSLRSKQLHFFNLTTRKK